METERQYKDSACMCFYAAIGIISLLLTAILSSCSTAKSTTDIRKDSTYIAERLTDKEKDIKRHSDSVYVHDSIYVYQKGDTVTKYVERTRYKTTMRYDTVRIERLRTDTVYAVRESMTSEKKEKPLNWYDKGFIWLGKTCCIVIILWIILLFLKRKTI